MSVYLINILDTNSYYSYLKKITITLLLLLSISIIPYAAELENNLNIYVEPYFIQSVHLKWLDESNISQNPVNESYLNNAFKNIGDMQLQGLLVPELGIVIKANNYPDSLFCLDLSIDAQIYDIYNINFSPLNFNVNKAYLSYKLDFLSNFLEDGINLKIGRDELFWGPSQNLDIRGSLDSLVSIIEDNSWDMLKYSGIIKISDNQKQNNNNLLNFDKIFSLFDNKWRLCLSEVTVINKYENSSLIYLNPIPILLFNYFAGQFLKKEQITDNLKINKNHYHNLGFDISWAPDKKLQLYAEMIFYDLSIRKELNTFLYTHNYGLTIGGYFSDIFTNKGKNADLGIEYSHLSLIEEANVFSASLIHDLTEKCQIELKGTIENSSNIDNQVNEKLEELTLKVELQYRF